MKSKSEWEKPEINFDKFQRQGMYHEQADGFSETESGSIEPEQFGGFVYRTPTAEEVANAPKAPRELSKQDTSPYKPMGCNAPMNSLVEPEPMPTTNNEPFMWDIVIADMRARDDFGANKYNTRLQPNTNRDPLKDAYQELLDAAVYIRTAIYERDGK